MKLRKRKHNREGSLCVVSSQCVCVCASEVGGHYSVAHRQFSEKGSGAQENPPVSSGQVKHTHT